MHDDTGTIKRTCDTSFDVKSSQGVRYLLHNRTPWPIRVNGPDLDDGELFLPPLAQRVVTGARLAPFAPNLRLLRQRHQLRVREYQDLHTGSGCRALLIWLGVLTTAVLVVHALLTEGTLERRPVAMAAVVTFGLMAWAIFSAMRSERKRKGDAGVADRDEGDIEFGVGGGFYDGNETLRRTTHLLTLAGVIAIGAVLPAVALFAATDAKDFLTMTGGLDIVDGQESRLVGRLIQVTYTAVLSLFPAILYFQFDRHRVGTIRGEWVRSIFRIDPRMKTLADVNARYGDQLSEASNYSTDSVRLLGGKNSPILVATLLISLGWTLLVARTTSFDFAGTNEVAAVAEAAGDVATQAQSDGDEAAADTALDVAERAAATEERLSRPFFEFLVPTPSAATMAFLGAYFFGVYLLLRSYFRGDLRPKIYNQITARLITVVVIAYLINTLFYDEGGQNRFVWALAFLAGIVPTTVLQQMGHLLSGFAGAAKSKLNLGKQFDDVFATPRALTFIDGIDIHDSSRLETEGITDIPSLAGGELVSTMIRTRLPVETLVDWTDQAVLILLLDDDTSEKLDPRIEDLRRIGIRTASAVVAAEDGAFGKNGKAAVASIVSRPSEDKAADVTCSLESLAQQIQHEPVMRQVRSWRNSDLGRSCDCTTIVVDRLGRPSCKKPDSPT